MLTLTIPGKPIPLQRARVSKNFFYDPQCLVKKNIRAYIKEQLPEGFKPFTGPLELKATFYLPTPKALPKYKKDLIREGAKIPHSNTPDTSNLIKFLEDCFLKFLFEDDRQIWKIFAKKIWALEGKTVFSLIETVLK